MFIKKFHKESIIHGDTINYWQYYIKKKDEHKCYFNNEIIYHTKFYNYKIQGIELDYDE